MASKRDTLILVNSDLSTAATLTSRASDFLRRGYRHEPEDFIEEAIATAERAIARLRKVCKNPPKKR